MDGSRAATAMETLNQSSATLSLGSVGALPSGVTSVDKDNASVNRERKL